MLLRGSAGMASGDVDGPERDNFAPVASNFGPAFSNFAPIYAGDVGGDRTDIDLDVRACLHCLSTAALSCACSRLLQPRLRASAEQQQ